MTGASQMSRASDAGGTWPVPAETTVDNPGPMTGEQRMLAACRREPVDRTPVWFMRQAGRCLAGYRALRERYDILTITRTPELCAQVTTMPVKEFGVDAAVMYADIMLPLFGMGVDFSIDPGVGPIVHTPVRDRAAVKALRIVDDPEEPTPDLFQAIRLVRKELSGTTALLGFAGAPYTVASYLIEGRPSKDHSKAKGLMYGDPETWHQLMETLCEVTIRYLRAQVAAGAQVIQLFDSWAGDLGPAAYEEFVLPYSQRIFASLHGVVPTIHFGTGTAGLLEQLAAAGSDMVSVDWRVPLDRAWERIGPDKGIQGNLDPAVMLAPMPVVEANAADVLRRAAGRPGHVFNLGHGVLPDTPSDNLARLREFVHTSTSRS
jgi:uroporphyrinogen decarboxylase